MFNMLKNMFVVVPPNCLNFFTFVYFLVTASQKQPLNLVYMFFICFYMYLNFAQLGSAS